MNRGDIDWALLAIGLSAEEASIYRLLVARGPSTVGALAPSAGLSRTKAYGVLDCMVASGYAEMVTQSPRTYAAIDPETILRSRQEDLGSASEVILRELKPVYRAQVANSQQVSLRGNAVFRRTEDMLKHAKREIVFVATFVPKELASKLGLVISEVCTRGVKVKTVVSEALAEEGLMGRLRDLVDLRVASVPNAGMLIVDDEEVLISSLPQGDLEARNGVDHGDYSHVQALWSRDVELVKLHRLLFDRMFTQGVA